MGRRGRIEQLSDFPLGVARGHHSLLHVAARARALRVKFPEERPATLAKLGALRDMRALRDCP